MAKKDTTIPVLLPESFSADNILQPLKLRKDLSLNLKAGMYCVIDTLVRMSQTRKWRDFYDQNGGYPLQATILNQLIGKNYVRVLELLEKSGVITRSKGYTVGEQSKLYNLVGVHATSNAVYKSIPSGAAIFAKLLAYKSENDRINKQQLSKIRYITKWFDPKRLRVDRQVAHSFIEFYRMHLLKLIPKKLPKKRTREEIVSRINLRVNAMISTVTSLENGEMNLTKTGIDNRLHSIVSNTKKELRGLFKFDDKEMVSVDLKASQPYLFNVLLNPKNWKKNGLIQRLYPELFEDLQQPNFKRRLESILMFGTFSKGSAAKKSNYKGFNSVAWSSDFYQEIINKAKTDGYEEVFSDRSATKAKMIRIFFDDGLYIKVDAAFKLFASWYPRESELIMLIKEAGRGAVQQSSKDKGVSYLPILLQRVESYLILERVCKRISELHLSAPLIPVHDCIMTTKDHADNVALIMEEVLTEEIGIEPGLTISLNDLKLQKKNISEAAVSDMLEILQKKPKGTIQDTKTKSPLMTLSEFTGEIVFVYVRGHFYNWYDPNATNVHLDF